MLSAQPHNIFDQWQAAIIENNLTADILATTDQLRVCRLNNPCSTVTAQPGGHCFTTL